MPIRVQLSRAKGWRMPENTVKVDRTTRYGNPHDWREWLENAPRDALPYAANREQWAKEQAAQAFADDLDDGTIVLDLEPLRGKNVACWCRPFPRFACHGDYLLMRANRPDNQSQEKT